jgi:hypothetical protein
MILVRMSGGLGNQLFQYAFGRLLSELSGRRLVLDALSFPMGSAPNRREFQLSRFTLDDATLVLTARDPLKERASASRNALKTLIRGIEWSIGSVVDTEESPGGAADISALLRRRMLLLIGYWQKNPEIEHLHQKLVQDLVPTAAVSDACAESVRTLKSANAVIVHVRRGDYLGIHDRFGRSIALPALWYQQAIDAVLDGVKDPVICVLSDDLGWALEHIRFRADVVIPEAAAPLPPVEVLMVMRAGSHHVVANSSLSWWGAWLANGVNQRVIAPASWFGEGSRGPWIPSDWRVL